MKIMRSNTIFLAIVLGVWATTLFGSEHSDQGQRDTVAENADLKAARAQLDKEFFAIYRHKSNNYTKIKQILSTYPSLMNELLWHSSGNPDGDFDSFSDPQKEYLRDNNTPLVFVGSKALQSYSYDYNIEMLEWLLANGVYVSGVTDTGNTIFHTLVENPNVSVGLLGKFLDKWCMEKERAWKMGCPVVDLINRANFYGQRPLDRLCSYDDSNLAAKLDLMLQNGANPNYACDKEHYDNYCGHWGQVKETNRNMLHHFIDLEIRNLSGAVHEKENKLRKELRKKAIHLSIIAGAKVNQERRIELQNASDSCCPRPGSRWERRTPQEMIEMTQDSDLRECFATNYSTPLEAMVVFARGIMLRTDNVSLPSELLQSILEMVGHESLASAAICRAQRQTVYYFGVAVLKKIFRGAIPLSLKRVEKKDPKIEEKKMRDQLRLGLISETVSLKAEKLARAKSDELDFAVVVPRNVSDALTSVRYSVLRLPLEKRPITLDGVRAAETEILGHSVILPD